MTFNKVLSIFFSVELVKKRRQARHRWRQTRNTEHKTAFNSISKLVEDRICKHNNDSFNYFTSTLGAIRDTDYSLWKVAKATMKRELKPTLYI